jgi:hypothetical protein
MSPMGCWVNIKDQVVISSPESPGPSATDLLNLHLRFGGALTLKQLFFGGEQARSAAVATLFTAPPLADAPATPLRFAVQRSEVGGSFSWAVVHGRVLESRPARYKNCRSPVTASLRPGSGETKPRQCLLSPRRRPQPQMGLSNCISRLYNLHE